MVGWDTGRALRGNMRKNWGKMVGWDTGRALRGGAARSVEPKIGAIADLAEIWYLE